MRFPPLAWAVLWPLMFTSPLVGQESLADLLDDPACQLARPADRARVVQRMTEIQAARRLQARARATQRGLPVRAVRADGRIWELVAFDGERPRYLTTFNSNAAISTGANLLRAAPYSLSGAGVLIGLWDGGAARSTHQELTGRVTVMDGATTIDHATHVAGTLIASGVVASARGMAASATVNSYEWTYDISEMTSRAATAPNQTTKIYLSNHSYGIISGWDYVNGGTPKRVWEWYGAGSSATSIETEFGLYNTDARDSDSLAFNAPYYLIFRAAGNDREDNPSAGEAVALSPDSGTVVSYDPALHPAGDGSYRGGFDTIGFDAIAKNVMTVGSVADAVSGGVRDVSKAALAAYTCWGPTDDGRIKPDVVANGEGLYSSLGGSNSAYGSYSGTSMATPNAVGSAALLIQQYGSLFPSQAMRAATLKGLLIHTADDLGNPGPDYKNGWGLLDVQAAADLLQDHQAFPAKQRLTENQLTSTTATRTHSFVWDGLSPITATLCWTDPAATALTTADSRSARLVNNLNLKIIAPNGLEFHPFVMPFVGTWTQAAMDSAATTGINNTDNVEQVRIAAPPVPGSYQALVTFSGTLANNSQYYSLLVSGSSAEPPPPPPSPAELAATPGNNRVTLTWSAASGATSYTAKRSLASGGPYAALGTTTTTSYIDTAATNGTTYYYVVSASNGGGESADSAPVSVIPLALPSATTLASTPATTGAYGTSVAFAATVTAGATGTVTFKDGTTVLGTATLSSGRATYTTSALAVGSHALTAHYAGDATFGASASSPLAYTVTPKPVTIVGVTAGTKVYDATPTANLTGGTVSGVVSGETVTVLAGAGTFASANAGTWAVTTTGYALGGTHAGNYVLAAQPAVAGATITPRPVQLAGARVYDGTAVAAADRLLVANNLDGAALTLTGSGYLTSKDAGTRALAVIGPATRLQVQTGSTGSGAASSLTVTLTAAPATGNTLIAVISTRGNAVDTVSGISQTGATWARAAQAANTSGTTTEIWYAANLAAADSVVTITTATSVFAAAVVMEYSGILSDSPLDQTAGATGNSSAAATGTTPATSQANELWIGGIGLSRANFALSNILNAFVTVATAQTSSSAAKQNAKVYALARVVSATGTAASGGTISSSSQWSGAIATFKAVTPGIAGTLALAGAAAPNYTLAGASGNVLVTPKPLTLAGLAASDRTYDGTTAAVLTGSAALLPEVAAADGSPDDGSPYTGDTVTVTGTPAGTFADKHAAALKPVSVTGTTLAGAQAPDYTLTQPADLTASIAPRPLTVAAVSVSKTYDGTTLAPGTPTLDPPLAPGDTASTLSQAFFDSNAGLADKVIVPTITIDDGNDGANYALTLVNCYTGTITPAPATITLAGLSQTYDGSPKPVTATTTPPDLTVAVTYDGSATPPLHAGSYAISAAVADPNHAGSAAGTLLIAKATATIVLSELGRTYDGLPKPVTATTIPPDLTVSVTYDGSAGPPVHAGSYVIAATIDDPDHAGSAAGTLLIAKAAATIVLTDLGQTYDGLPKPVTATTTPPDLTVSVTYAGASQQTTTATPDLAGTGGGSVVPPTHAGSYAVTAAIDDADHAGTATATLVIAKAGAAIVLTGLTQTYDGTPRPVTATTTPAGLTVETTYDGSATPPGDVGTYAVTASINDMDYLGEASGSLVIIPATAWKDWCDDHFTPAEQSAGLASDGADPDADGRPNLAEYALGSDPRQFTPPLVPSLAADRLSLTFTRPAALPALEYAAESTADLATWAPVPLEVLETGTTETLRASVPLNPGDPAPRFLRLRFERH